jgi:hypothetical protein
VTTKAKLIPQPLEVGARVRIERNPLWIVTGAVVEWVQESWLRPMQDNDRLVMVAYDDWVIEEGLVVTDRSAWDVADVEVLA